MPTDQTQGRQLEPPSRVPAPRKPKAQGFVRPPETSEPGGESVAPTGESTPAPALATPEGPVISSRRPAIARKASQAPKAPAGGLRKAQIYLDKAIDDYLWQIRAEAAGQRLDVPSAAVARLAFHRLIEDMSPAEVVKHLATAEEHEGPGRKRR